MTLTPQRRRLAGHAARAGAVMSAGMFLLSLWTVAIAGRSPADAATNNGAASIVGAGGTHEPLTSGGSATEFNLSLGTNPVCPGDSASGNYRVQSFMIPASADIDAMTFDANGPVAVGSQFRQPLFDTNSSPYVNKLTDLAVPPATTGGISGLPAFNFGVFTPGDVPIGDYTIGIACTLGSAGPDQLKTFWSVTVAVTERADDLPAGITWTVTTTPTTTTTEGGSTTTTTDGSTTTTAGETTTTTTGDSTTTTTGDSTTTTTYSFGASDPSDPSVSSTVGDLPLTGSSPGHLVAWGLCLIVFGRMAVLLGRQPKAPPRPGG